MRIVADERVDGPIVVRRREDGHEVDYVAEMELGISDDRVPSHANERQALLITTDKDFGDLVVRQSRLNAGVLLLRLPGVSPRQKAEIVSGAVTAHGTEMQIAVSVITSKIVRIRPKQ